VRRRSLLVPRALRPVRSSGFWRRREGATAVEFALIAAPLVFMLFSVIDLACVMLAQATLDQAVSEGARLVRTGQMQTGANNTASALQADVCAQMTWAQSNCLENLYLDVRTYTSFASASPPNPVTNKTFNPSALTYSPGQQGDVVVVRAYYQWKLFTPFLAPALASLGNGTMVIMSTAAFKNEPYS
jgi:Flp pilus assembly protein TadG